MSESLNPQQLAAEGRSAYQRGDYQAAERSFAAAKQGFLALGDGLNAAEMANNCCVALLQANDPQAALQAVEGTAAIFANAGDARRQAMALGNLASALDALEQVDEAVEAYRQSAEVFEQIGEDELRLQVLQSLSRLQMRKGRQLEALATMQSGLDGLQRPSPRQQMLKGLLRLPFGLLNR